jgi:hypothetical protein
MSDQYFPEILPITRNLSSSLVITGISIRSASFHRI